MCTTTTSLLTPPPFSAPAPPDGVIYGGDAALPGAVAFVQFLQAQQRQFVFLTNASDKTEAQLSAKLCKMGIRAIDGSPLGDNHFYTSAMATASFLARQHPGATVFMVGEPALHAALSSEGIRVLDDAEADGARQSRAPPPDYVVVGETREQFTYANIELAIALVRRGARLIGTNPDTADRVKGDLVPGTGALVRPIEAVSQRSAFFLGKPNPMMVASAMRRLGCERHETLIVGDRMNTDIIAGVEADIDSVLVLSGVTMFADLATFSYRPVCVIDGVAELHALLDEARP